MLTQRFDLCTDDSPLFFVKLAGDRRTDFRVTLCGQVEIEIYGLSGRLHVRDFCIRDTMGSTFREHRLSNRLGPSRYPRH